MYYYCVPGKRKPSNGLLSFSLALLKYKPYVLLGTPTHHLLNIIKAMNNDIQSDLNAVLSQ